MSWTGRRPRRVIAAATLAAAFALSGCAAGQIAQTADQVSGVDGASGDAGPIGIRNVLLATPSTPNYPKGSDARVLMFVSNQGFSADTLTGVSSPVAASVDITGKANVPAQSLVNFNQASGGTEIVMKDLTQQIDYAVPISLTFSFQHAGQITVLVPIEIPEQRTGPRTKTSIWPSEPPNVWQSPSNG